MDFDVYLTAAEEGGYTVMVPALPGCITEGDTEEEALAHAREAIQGYLEAFGCPLQPSLHRQVSIEA